MFDVRLLCTTDILRLLIIIDFIDRSDLVIDHRAIWDQNCLSPTQRAYVMPACSARVSYTCFTVMTRAEDELYSLVNKFT